MTAPELTTERLLLRGWSERDRGAFAEMNADPRVMAHFPKPLTREESDAMVTRIAAHFERHGYGLWAVEVPGVADFIGFIGLAIPSFDAPFMPAVEIGWRLARAHWGQGYATEGARAALAFGFERVGLAQIVSFTVPENHASRRVMEKIGLAHDPANDFEHPRLEQRLRRHLLYKMAREAWQAAQAR